MPWLTVCLLSLRFDDGDRNTEFLEKNVVCELFLFLVARGHIVSDYDGAKRESYFSANLLQRNPTGDFDCQ